MLLVACADGAAPERPRASPAKVVEEYAREAAPSTFGGVYVERRDAEKVVALFTGGVDRHERALRARLPRGQQLEVLPVRFSLRELERVRRSLSRDRARLGQEGIDVRGIGVDVRDNVVRVGVASRSASRAAALRERYGPAVEVERVVAAPR